MTISNGFIKASDARSGNITDITVHREITSIEEQILIQSGNGFLSTTINNTIMTDTSLNTSTAVSAITSSGVSSGNTLILTSLTNIANGMSVRDITTPDAISGSVTVTSINYGTNAITLSSNLTVPGVRNSDVLYFSNLTVATSVGMPAYKDTLWMASTAGIQVGMIVEDKTVSGIIVPGTKVISIGSGEEAGSIQLSLPFIGNVGTGDLIEFSFYTTNVSTGSSTITLSGVTTPVGTPVTFSSTGTLPAPLSTATTYYLVPTATQYVYGIASTKQNSYQSTPILVVLTDVGTGLMSATVETQSQLYFTAWQDYSYNPESRIYSQQMLKVINYFTDLGYTITRVQAIDINGNTIGVMNWYITW